MPASPRISKNIYFVAGSDEAAVKTAASQLAESLAPERADAFSLEVINGAAESVDQAVKCLLNTAQALLTFPFLQEKKLVWLKNASMLSDSIIGRSESVIATLEKLQNILESGLPKGILFLISAPEADKRRSFYKAICKLAEIKICDKPNFGWNSTDADISDWLRQKASAHGLHFTPTALDLLTTRIGADTRQAELEFDKLNTALASEKKGSVVVTESLIQELVPATRESGIFDLSHALLARNMSLSLESLQQLFFQGDKAITILLVAIIPTIRNLLITKDLLERYKLPPPQHPSQFAQSVAHLLEESISHLPKKKDGTVNTYALGLAATNCHRYSLAELKSALNECLETNRLLISTILQEKVVLTRLLLRIIGTSDLLARRRKMVQ